MARGLLREEELQLAEVAPGQALLATKAHAQEHRVQGMVLQQAVLAFKQVGLVPEVEQPSDREQSHLEEDSDTK